MAEIHGLKMNIGGCNDVRNSSGVMARLLSIGRGIGNAAEAMGCPCTVDVQPGKTRAHAMVKTKGLKGLRENARSNALLKSLDAGRS